MLKSACYIISFSVALSDTFSKDIKCRNLILQIGLTFAVVLLLGKTTDQQ